MYEAYWKLAEAPFSGAPDPRFIYLSKQHEEGLMRLLYLVKAHKGAGMLTGIFGCGKTLLAHTLFDQVKKEGHKFVNITNPRLDDVELLRMIAHQLGIPSPSERKADVLIAIQNSLLDNLRDGKQTIIVIDEAHTIQDASLFEEIRLLLNFQKENQFLLTLFLLGQPELMEKIDLNKPLAQRLAMRFHLQQLGATETQHYILHRLNVAQASRQIFSPEAVALIYEMSGGIPRRINQICDMSLFSGWAKQAMQIDPEIVRDAVASIEGQA